MLKGFLFDLDGTIWDSEKTIVKTIFQTVSEAEIKISEDEILKQFKDSVSPIAVLSYYGVPTELFWKNYRKNYTDIQLFFNNTSEVLSTLLIRKRSIGFITSLKKEFALTLLEKFDLPKYSSVLITPSECRRAKPSPAPINMALSRLSIENIQSLYIGDQNSDIVASKRAGCKSGLAKWGARNAVIETPDYVFEKLGDVLPLSEEG
jgi:pyrophosphatase PpaX